MLLQRYIKNVTGKQFGASNEGHFECDTLVNVIISGYVLVVLDGKIQGSYTCTLKVYFVNIAQNRVHLFHIFMINPLLLSQPNQELQSRIFDTLSETFVPMIVDLSLDDSDKFVLVS